MYLLYWYNSTSTDAAAAAEEEEEEIRESGAKVILARMELLASGTSTSIAASAQRTEKYHSSC